MANGFRATRGDSGRVKPVSILGTDFRLDGTYPHIIKVGTAASSVNIHKALAGARASMHDLTQMLSHMQSVALIPKGDLANGLCFGNALQLVVRSEAPLFAVPRRYTLLNTLSNSSGSSLSVSSFQAMGLYRSPEQLMDRDCMVAFVNNILLPAEAQSACHTSLLQIGGFLRLMFVRALHFVGQHAGSPFSAGALAGTGLSKDGDTLTNVAVETWFECLMSRVRDADKSRAHELEELFNILRRLGLISLRQLYACVVSARKRMGRAGIFCPIAPTGRSRCNAGIVAFREACLVAGIQPPDSGLSWAPYVKVGKMKVSKKEKTQLREETLKDWAAHWDKKLPGFEDALKKGLAADDTCRLATFERHWRSWGQGELKDV